MNKELAEKFQIKYGWTPEAVLSISDEQIKKMKEENLERYFEALMLIYDSTHEVTSYPVINGSIHCPKEEDWQ